MPKTYVHLTETERELIASMRLEGKSPSEIARVLDRDKGTISRELRRNASTEYSRYTPCRAQKRSDQRKLTARHDRPLLKSKKIQQYVRRKLKIGWSPEIIAGCLKNGTSGLSISPEAIYPFIYHRDTPDRGQTYIPTLSRLPETAHQGKREKSARQSLGRSRSCPRRQSGRLPWTMALRMPSTRN